MLRRMFSERPHDWEKYLLAIVFAISEESQELLGYNFVPFELLYGRSVSGLITILKEIWKLEVYDQQVPST